MSCAGQDGFILTCVFSKQSVRQVVPDRSAWNAKACNTKGCNTNRGCLHPVSITESYAYYDQFMLIKNYQF